MGGPEIQQQSLKVEQWKLNVSSRNLGSHADDDGAAPDRAAQDDVKSNLLVRRTRTDGNDQAPGLVEGIQADDVPGPHTRPGLGCVDIEDRGAGPKALRETRR
jgi:hypothetical protein